MQTQVAVRSVIRRPHVEAAPVKPKPWVPPPDDAQRDLIAVLLASRYGWRRNAVGVGIPR